MPGMDREALLSRARTRGVNPLVYWIVRGVLQPFFRIENSRNASTGGIGLGLTIARDVMLSHGGALALETSPQGGLRARCSLPAMDVAALFPEARASHTAPQPSPP